MELIVDSPKYGVKTITIDDEDYTKVKGHVLYVWTTPRHHTFYVFITIDGTAIRLRRYLMGVTNPKIVVDHIYGDGLDNRKSHLRVCTQAVNNCNARKRKNARTSKHKGVHFCVSSNKWKAQIQHLKKKHALGSYLTEDEAAEAYNLAARQYHGDAAVLNIVEVK